MSSSICTLFENHYHFGVAALTNSVYKQGYKGSIYAGYRGNLPSWANEAKEDEGLNWPGARTLHVAEGLQLHFLPLETDYHLTNYKPDFMIRLLDGPAKKTNAIFYFDPDIVVAASWSSFTKWIDCGVALCEDVNSPLSENHPRRIAWRKYFKEKNIFLAFKEGIYANGGFIGLKRENRSFLELWKKIQLIMAPQIGGLNRSALNGTRLPLDSQGPFAPFDKTDQDALNATVEAWEGDVSFVGKEGMAFKSGGALMPHALGQPKPWKWKPVFQALAGSPPRLVDKEYWKSANGVIIAQPLNLVRHRKFCISLAALIGRFYRRGTNVEY
jgi:hypothetical protein